MALLHLPSPRHLHSSPADPFCRPKPRACLSLRLPVLLSPPPHQSTVRLSAQLRGRCLGSTRVRRCRRETVRPTVECRALDADVTAGADAVVQEKSVSVVLLAGGKGTRMGANMPKQYLPLLGQPIALFSFFTFSRMPEVKEIVVVCDPSYRSTFEDYREDLKVGLKFAVPGKERQDSVFNGFQEIDDNSELVCIHDSARPLVLTEDINKVLKDALQNGAAVLGVPVKATIKEADNNSFVVKTLDRKTLWEMQTPQVMKPHLLRSGFELIIREGLEVTDDVSIVEHLKQPVYVTEGSYTNIKITTPDDLLLAERILKLEEQGC